MRLFFAGFHESRIEPQLSPEFVKSICVLGSYYYLSRKGIRKTFDPTTSRDFILDCGAFSFTNEGQSDEARNKITGSINWKEYIREYADFIKEFKIKNYIEVDIDAIIGYQRVKDYRNMLEDLVGWPCMPVYHIGRTDEEFIESCQGRPYVCYGTNSGEYAKNNPNVARIAKMAHEQGCKIHLLGVSNPVPFQETDIIVDSCDAATWILNHVYGVRPSFDQTTNKMKKVYVKKVDQLSPSWREKAYSLSIWRRYAKYMARNVDIVWPEDANATYPHLPEDDMTEEEISEMYRTKAKA